jgi:hypothetical protein
MDLSDEHVRVVLKEAGRHERWAKNNQDADTGAVHLRIARALREVASFLQSALLKP